MNLLSMFSFLRRSTNGNGMRGVAMMTATVPTVTTTETRRVKAAKPSTVVEIEGESGYNALRRFRFKSAYPHAAHELLQNRRILIERDENPGQIYVEADEKETPYQTEDHIRIISIKHVVGVIYHSRSGNTELRWRDNKPTDRVWGHAVRRSLATLLSCNVRIKAKTAPIPVS